MYLLNYLSLQTVQQLFISVGRYRTEQGLVGVKDGSNTVFHTPGGEKFVNNQPFLTMQVFYNGLRQNLLDDYVLQESGGLGTGFDTIVFSVPPVSIDTLLVDYVII